MIKISGGYSAGYFYAFFMTCQASNDTCQEKDIYKRSILEYNAGEGR